MVEQAHGLHLTSSALVLEQFLYHDAADYEEKIWAVLRERGDLGCGWAGLRQQVLRFVVDEKRT